jgi:hypothetical protein
MARRRLLRALADAFTLDWLAAPQLLPLLLPPTLAGHPAESGVGDGGDRSLWGDAALDGALLTDAQWLAKHQRPL